MSLSGGQKSRVAFAILCAHNPNFLILDEPTNHLDIQTIEALGNGLLKYKVILLVKYSKHQTRRYSDGYCTVNPKTGFLVSGIQIVKSCGPFEFKSSIYIVNTVGI